MARTDEEREDICKKYEEDTHELLDEWINDDNEDEQNADRVADDEIDGLKKDLKRMFGNCFGKDFSRKEICRKTLNNPST